MNSPKAPTLPAELAMPSRREGLLSLLFASPMTLLGCTPEPLPADTEGSSSGGPMGSSTSSTGVADSGSTTIALTGDGTTSTGPTDTTGTPMTSSTTDASSSSSGSSSGSSSSSSEGGESTTGGVGNTCERVGDLIDMCFGGYGYYYEDACSYYINYFIGIGDFACASAYNEFYSCVADLECAEVNMGIWQACAEQWDNVSNTCWGWGGSETFVGSDSFGDSGGGFIDPSGTGGFGSGSGGFATTGGFGSGGFATTGDDGVLFDLPPI